MSKLEKIKKMGKGFNPLTKKELSSIYASTDECDRYAHLLNLPPRSFGSYRDTCYWMLIRIAQAQRDKNY